MPDARWAARYELARRVAYKKTGNFAAAEDIAQDVMYELIVKAKKLQGHENVDAWIRRVAWNKGADYWRRTFRNRRRGRQLAIAILVREQLQPLESEVAGDRIDALHLLARLPPRARNLLVLYHVDGYSYQELGEKMGERPDTIRMQIRRAEQHLRQLLVEET